MKSSLAKAEKYKSQNNMPIKINLPEIPQVESVSLDDAVLIGSSANTGTARLAKISLLRAIVGTVYSGSLISADDGYVYQLYGHLVDGEITISLIQMWSGVLESGAGARISADDGHEYALSGVTVNGIITIEANQI